MFKALKSLSGENKENVSELTGFQGEANLVKNDRVGQLAVEPLRHGDVGLG